MNRIVVLAPVALLMLRALVFGAETNHNFSVWEKEIQAYEARDRTNPPPKGAILFLGSSGIRLWTTLAQDFPEYQVINRGVGGCEIVDLTHFAERIVFPYEPRTIVFRCGGNDIANNRSPEDVFNDFKEFTAKLQMRLPATEIVFLSWNPTILRWSNREKEKTFNELVRKYAAETPRVRYVETADLLLDENGQPKAELLAPDKLHFSRAGYRLLTERVRSALAKP